MVTNPFDETPVVHFDEGDVSEWQEEVDSHSAAAILGVTVNNLRQMVHKKKLTVTRREKRRAYFRSAEVHELVKIREDKKMNKRLTSDSV